MKRTALKLCKPAVHSPEHNPAFAGLPTHDEKLARTIGRAFAILKLLTPGEWMRVCDLSRTMGLPESTAQRLMKALHQSGIVLQDEFGRFQRASLFAHNHKALSTRSRQEAA